MILVPRVTGLTEVFQLNDKQQSQLVEESNFIAEKMKTLVQADKMNIAAFDIISLIILFILAIRATFRGFLTEIMSMASVIVGITIAIIFTRPVSVLLQDYIGHSIWNMIIAFLGLFLVSYLIIKIFENSLNTLIERVQLEKLDQSLGFFLGLVEGFLLIVIIVFALQAQQFFSIDNIFENSYASSIAEKIIPLGTKLIEEGI